MDLRETEHHASDDAPRAEGEVRHSRWRGLLLVGLAVVSVVFGFALGRVLRERQAPASSFQSFAVPTLVGGASALGGDHPLVGVAAPPFTMQDVVTGKDVSLSDYAGRPVLVNFWATWCPPCRLEMPWLQAAAEQYAGAGLVVLAVNAGERMAAEDAPGAIRAFRDSYGLTFPVLNGSTAEAIQSEWGVWGLPASFLVDGSGTVVDAQIGMYPSQDDLERRLSTLVQMR
jgi:thiol-disulfide isomerase/thioredoxin